MNHIELKWTKMNPREPKWTQVNLIWTQVNPSGYNEHKWTQENNKDNGAQQTQKTRRTPDGPCWSQADPDIPQ